MEGIKKTSMNKKEFYGKQYIQCIDPEWCQDGYLDFTIVVDSKMLLDQNFGFNVEKVIEEEYNKTDLGCFWCTDRGFTWLWVIAGTHNPITERTRRKQIGRFHLLDSETESVMPNTKYWREFKKGIVPLIEQIMKKELQKK